ncbi:MAG: glycoside hydrolase family 3 N-terminal domain-containing protein [Trueperaceae bacterium]|nr:glycoside hydrolase family 3 N-terminal domain-containing protein [Trueperaceae bacterium]
MPWRRRLLLLALTASLVVLAGLIPKAEPPVPVSVVSVGSPEKSVLTPEVLRARAAQHTLLPTVPECPSIPQQISTWTPEQRVAQQLVSYWPPYTPNLPPLGGVMVTRVHGPDIDSVRRFTRALSVPARTPAPLLVTDQEGGMVTRLVDPQLEVFASNAAISRLERGVQRTGDQGETFAAALTRAGIQANLAPVVDVATRANPVISGLGRAYSSDPEVVTAHATAFVLATQQQGRAATLKHFPGHGMVTLDSHQTLPTSDIDWPTLWRTHLYPYRTLFSHPDVRHDLLMVMTGHVRFSQLDNDAPASLSPTITTTLLRQQLGFDGVIITDALGMGALSGPIEERVVRALGAGADFALLEAPYHEQIPLIIDTLVARYDAEPARWWANAQSLRRIITLKAALGLVGTDANGCITLP